jgi:hypothetical protein
MVRVAVRVRVTTGVPVIIRVTVRVSTYFRDCRVRDKMKFSDDICSVRGTCYG